MKLVRSHLDVLVIDIKLRTQPTVQTVQISIFSLFHGLN